MNNHFFQEDTTPLSDASILADHRFGAELERHAKRNGNKINIYIHSNKALFDRNHRYPIERTATFLSAPRKNSKLGDLLHTPFQLKSD